MIAPVHAERNRPYFRVPRAGGLPTHPLEAEYETSAEFQTPAGPVNPADHIRLAHACAKRFMWAIGKSLDYEDLVQAGCVGLCIAAQRFEPERGLRFSTYAFHWVLQKTRRAVAYALWEAQSIQDAAARSSKDKTIVSLDTLVRESERMTVGDFVESHYGANWRTLNRELRETFGGLISGMTDRQKKVAALRYIAGWTLGEIGAELHLTRERIRQICEYQLEPRMRRNAVLHGYVDRDEAVA